MNSEHPLAGAIVNSAKKTFGGDFTFSSQGIQVTDSLVIPGKGVEAVISKEGWGRWVVRVGKASFAKEVPGTSQNEPETARDVYSRYDIVIRLLNLLMNNASSLPCRSPR